MRSTTTGTGVRGRYLAVDLNDHLAGSTAVIELVRRAAREHEGTDLAAELFVLDGPIPGQPQQPGSGAV